MRDLFRRLYSTLIVQFGVNPLQALRALSALPAFTADWVKFRKMYDGRILLLPCLHDRRDKGGDATSEYFIQDLEIARRIHRRNPVRHVDVGSRVDGFVAHVACFREIEVLDIRPTVSKVEGMIFTQADLMNAETALPDYCDSVSCLHAIEHFGLGRYGDQLDPLGWIAGLEALARLLKMGGRLYLSTPVGVETVVFNAHRIFPPTRLIAEAERFGLKIDHLSWVSDGAVQISTNIDSDAYSLGRRAYTLGIFEFLKQ